MSNSHNSIFDVIVLGGGAAGLFAASQTNEHLSNILVLEGNKTLGKKIRISGGGRCNFTNENVSFDNFFSSNPHFVKSALSQFSSHDFINLVKKYKIPFYEKSKGQLFCKESAGHIIGMLEKECLKRRVVIKASQSILEVIKNEDLFQVKTNKETFICRNLIVATGGLSMSAIGATDIGYKIAKSFKHKIIPTRQALVPLKLKEKDLKLFGSLSGISCQVSIKIKNKIIQDDLLFTHRGLSGPAILQASCLWEKEESLTLNLLPEIKFEEVIKKEKKRNSKKKIGNFLPRHLCTRLSEVILKFSNIDIHSPICELSDKKLNDLALNINSLVIYPSGYEIMNKAEVTFGGVDTKDISSKTMESKKVPGLYFIGEVLDVTGQLGGFNFQWAWSSAYACAKSIA